jgi:hypothetical protein
MNKELISRAMRQLAKHRHQHEDKARTKAIMSKAGKASWQKLSQAERKARLARMVAGRRKQREAGAMVRPEKT